MLLRKVGQHALAMFAGQRLAAQRTGGRIRGLEHLDLFVQRLPVGLDAIVLGPQRGRPLADLAQRDRDRIAPGLLLGHVRQDRLRCGQRLRLLLARRNPATELGLAVGQPAILGLQRQPGLIHGQPRPVDALAQLGVAKQAGVPRGIFGARGAERGPAGLDRRPLRQHRVELRQPHFGRVKLAAAVEQIALRAGQPAAQIGQVAGLRTALLHGQTRFDLFDLGCAKRRGALGGRSAGSLQPRLIVSPPRKLGVDPRNLTADPRRLLLARLGLLFGAFLVEIVTPQAQDVGKDLLAFAGGLDREGIGPALEQEGRVDKGLVVESQGADDLRLALDQAAVVEELPIADPLSRRRSWSRIQI